MEPLKFFCIFDELMKNETFAESGWFSFGVTLSAGIESFSFEVTLTAGIERFLPSFPFCLINR